ncbi:uncharacterized protein HMPREF1541_07236 [Cyphellophora europaea CBS 101466]|uniref:Uncharacterized protein n=1 Tax=Cyphellophora europaea (strain CBS 101466) TaxID=1220924 RepID=W2RPF5_CYPE1|nr:uncharacterized protein HMPREF1541_07236 [Cyphellophora europaea CBS 101466]ETN37614.1 hypothetical protein HMPREF1541_07236 [Cyphellophora europaea CBS 101466]
MSTGLAYSAQRRANDQTERNALAGVIEPRFIGNFQNQNLSPEARIMQNARRAIDAKTSEVASLQAQITQLQQQNTRLQQDKAQLQQQLHVNHRQVHGGGNQGGLGLVYNATTSRYEPTASAYTADQLTQIRRNQRVADLHQRTSRLVNQVEARVGGSQGVVGQEMDVALRVANDALTDMADAVEQADLGQARRDAWARTQASLGRGFHFER